MVTDHCRFACIQLRSTDSVAENIMTTSELVKAAASDGADFIATPEMTGIMQMKSKALFAEVDEQSHDRSLNAFQALASELNVWLLIGSLAIKISESQCANRSFLIAPSGALAATYDKIHMFDVEVGDGQTYRESKVYRAGDRAVLCETPWGMVGLTVCYDIRFAYLYRQLAQAGASILTVPAAFTYVTGTAHWHTLLRARAIETGCFVVAPAQGGIHADGRHTYGHSLIYGPWGDVLACLEGEEPGFIAADLDLAEVAAARQKIPALQHDRKIPTEIAS